MFNIRCLFFGWAFRTDGAAGLARAITQLANSLFTLYFIFLFLFFVPFDAFAIGDCPGASTLAASTCGEPQCFDSDAQRIVDGVASQIEGGKSSIVTVDSFSANGFHNVYVCNAGPFAGCGEGQRTISGKYGANYSCEPVTPCPQGQEHDALGQCVPAKTRDQHMQDCANVAADAGGNSVFHTNLDTGESTCIVGAKIGDGMFSPAPPCLQKDFTSCYANPLNASSQDGWQCGTFNGKSVCIASAASGAIGVGANPLGFSKTTGTVHEMKDVQNDGVKTTTTTTTTTPTTETTRSPAINGSLASNEKLDKGSVASIPLTYCGDGRVAANTASCDSLVHCLPTQYLAYGVCLAIPTKVSEVHKDVTDIKVEVIDNATGQLISSTITTSSKTVSSGTSGLGTGSTTGGVGSPAPTGKGECDPTAADYQECLGLLVSVSDTQAADDKAKNDAAATSAVDSIGKSVEDSLAADDGFSQVPTSFFARLNSTILTSSSSDCLAFSITILGSSTPIPCTLFDKFKALFGWFLYLFTTWTIFGIVKKPVER